MTFALRRFGSGKERSCKFCVAAGCRTLRTNTSDLMANFGARLTCKWPIAPSIVHRAHCRIAGSLDGRCHLVQLLQQHVPLASRLSSQTIRVEPENALQRVVAQIWVALLDSSEKPKEIKHLKGLINLRHMPHVPRSLTLVFTQVSGTRPSNDS